MRGAAAAALMGSLAETDIFFLRSFFGVVRPYARRRRKFHAFSFARASKNISTHF
jgi:hypothetical protein